MTSQTIMQKYRFSLLIVPIALLTAAALPVQAEKLLTDLTACRALQSDAERLNCYDRLGEPATSDVAAKPDARPSPSVSATVQPATAAATPVSTEEVFGLDADKVRQSYAEAAGEDEVDELRASITQVLKAGPDRVQLVLDNDQVWRQIDSSRLKPKVGDAVAIKKGAFGSFKLKKVGSNRSMRVKRIE